MSVARIGISGRLRVTSRRLTLTQSRQAPERSSLTRRTSRRYGSLARLRVFVYGKFKTSSAVANY